VLLVQLHRLFGVDVVLDNLLICTTGQEDVLLVFSRMEGDALGILFHLIIANNFARLGVP
jgi:hypothetical protein